MFRLHPNRQGQMQFLFEKQKSLPYTTNSGGFRDREPGPKMPGILRVVVLGDSYTFGWAVEQNEAYPRQAEALLRDAGYAVEIFNLGVPGYNTEQELHLLKEALPTYQPNLVVLGYVVNDAEPPMNVPVAPAQIYRFAWSWLWEDAKESLRDAMKGPKWASIRPWVGSRKYTFDMNFSAGFEPESIKWRVSKAALADMAVLCRQEGVRFAVLILPGIASPWAGVGFGSSYPCSIIHEKVSAWGRELGIETIDVLPRFRGRNMEPYHVPGDGHPSPLAHEEFAKVLREVVVGAIAKQAGESSACVRDAGPVVRSVRTAP